MYVLVGVAAALFLLTFLAARSRDRVAKASAFVAWAGALVAFASSWHAAYRWSNQSGCPAAYPDEFGYRAPNWEQLPNAVSDTSSWWPLGRVCSGLDARTGQLLTIEPSWSLSIAVYSCVGCAVVAGLVVIIRVAR